MLVIARERIERLFLLAEAEANNRNYARADRYASLAVKIGMRYNVRIPTKYKMRFCRGCGTYLIPGVNCTTRLNRGVRLVRCGKCGRLYRMPYKK
jgi:ribonuclease P protein subunit RPR2